MDFEHTMAEADDWRLEVPYQRRSRGCITAQEMLESRAHYQTHLNTSHHGDPASYHQLGAMSPSAAAEERLERGRTILTELEQSEPCDILCELTPLKAPLEEYLEEIWQWQMMTQGQPPVLDSEAHRQLLTFLDVDCLINTTLWIEGPPDLPRPSPSTTLALSLLSEETREVKFVHWFYDGFYGIAPEAMSSVESGLMDMLRSLITQLIMLAPAERLSSFRPLLDNLRPLRDKSITFDDAFKVVRRNATDHTLHRLFRDRWFPKTRG